MAVTNRNKRFKKMDLRGKDLNELDPEEDMDRIQTVIIDNPEQLKHPLLKGRKKILYLNNTEA